MEVPEDELLVSRATEEDALTVISLIQRSVLKLVPDAKLMPVANKRGEINSIAIYDCKIILNHRGHIDVKNSESPQRISDLFDYDESWTKHNRIGVLKLEAEVWADVLLRQMKLGNLKWCKLKREWKLD
jgi:hypothetical protein